MVLKIKTMGFKTCMRRETNVNETNPNYGIVGLGSIMVTRMVPLMLLRVSGSPRLGLGSTIHLVISLGLWMVGYWLCTVNGGDSLVKRGKFSLGCNSITVSFIFLLKLYTSHPLSFRWL